MIVRRGLMLFAFQAGVWKFCFIPGSEYTPFRWMILAGPFALSRLRANWSTPYRLSRQQKRHRIRQIRSHGIR